MAAADAVPDQPPVVDAGGEVVRDVQVRHDERVGEHAVGLGQLVERELRLLRLLARRLDRRRPAAPSRPWTTPRTGLAFLKRGFQLPPRLSPPGAGAGSSDASRRRPPIRSRRSGRVVAPDLSRATWPALRHRRPVELRCCADSCLDVVTKGHSRDDPQM